jgi:siroheme decarboxylase
MNDNQTPDPLDLRILDALQQDIPLVNRPWAALASRLDISEELFLERLKHLHTTGVVRGISPILESSALGITAATLVAIPVPVERIRETAGLISHYPEVSHNFRRDHKYSLWFTLSAENRESLEKTLDEILKKTGFSRDEILDLPTVKKIKIDVRFPLVTGTREAA